LDFEKFESHFSDFLLFQSKIKIWLYNEVGKIDKFIVMLSLEIIEN